MAFARVLFARIGWMKRYKGQQADDEKPIGGGKYTKNNLGHEIFNFLPIGDMVFGHFTPQMQAPEIRKRHPASIKLERIEHAFTGDALGKVLVIFIARNPQLGGQRIVGWYSNATVHRTSQRSSEKPRKYFKYYVETATSQAVLVPPTIRSFVIPSGKGAFGQANVCYLLDSQGKPKTPALWMRSAIEYVEAYRRENAAKLPESESDPEIAEIIESTIERGAGFQSNPRIRKAIEEYSMKRAFMRLTKEGLRPADVHKTQSYDYCCKIDGAELHVEVKGMQDSGKAISLTPKEVQHAQKHKNSALFIVHSVKVKGKRNPKVSGGQDLFLRPWDISAGALKARSYVFTLAESTSASKQPVSTAS